QEPSPKKLKVTHDTQRFCDVCSEHVSSRDYVGHLRSVKHKNNSLAFSTEGVQVITSAFKSRIVSYRISANTQYINLKEFVESLADVIKKLVREQIDIMGSVKVNCELFGYFILESKDRGEVKSFNTRNQVLTISSDLSEWFKDIIEKLEVDATEFEHRESAIYTPTGHPCEPDSYPDYLEKFNFEGITFSVKLDAISKFEEMNPLSINVYGLEEDTQKQDGNSHYCYISNMSRLISMQVSKHKEAIYLCDGCLQYFTSQENLWRHSRFDCNYVCTFLPTKEPILTKWGQPSFDNRLKFNNYQNKIKHPFVVYADFESLLKPIEGPQPNPLLQFTTKTFEHEPYSFAYYIKCSFDDKFSKFQIYRGANAPVQFINILENDILTIYNQHFKQSKPLQILTEEERRKINLATNYGICEKPFVEGDVKVIDHDHQTSFVRAGLCHSICNLQLQTPNFIPVFFHNLTGYDSHLFVKSLALENENIDVIAGNKEKYISFSKHIVVDQIVENGVPKNLIWRIRFVDSFRFLASSLNVLAKNLSDSECTEITKFFGSGREFELIRQKGVFPYSFVDSYDKLNLTTIPNKSDFFDMLHEQDITDEEYRRAQEVWNLFNCQTLGEYSDIYLKSDVLLLADIFENYRGVCLREYEIDAAQYLTGPNLSWDAMLKKTDVELELLTDIDMLHFFKRGIRGGVSTCTKRKAIANNKFLPNYDPSKPSSFIIYLDACNLYGHSQTQFLPQSDFVWLTPEEIQNFNVFEISDESPIGYVLEVDLLYPEALHNLQNDMPYCPESITPPNSRSKYKKLIPNLNHKEKYVLHYRMLRQCLQHGLILKNIHRGVKFTQSPWLKSYIDLNTELRNRETSESGRDTIKTMNNSIYGKTMENVDKRVNVALVSHWERIGKKPGAEGHISKPNFKNLSVFSENLVAIEMSKVSVKYNKP
ncbi:hypothetical protein PPYR_15409, partial [Photinus pyralis]